MVGILYCNKSKLNYKEIESILLTNNIEATCIAIEEANSYTFDSFSLIINAMDSFFPEDKIALMVNYFNSGKNMIHLCATPFTLNYEDGKSNNRMLRSFGIIDDFSPIDKSSVYVKTSLEEKYNIVLTGFHGAVFHLCEHHTDGQNYPNAHLEHILDAYDSYENLIATPIIRVITHRKGSMTFFSFDFDSTLFRDPFFEKLFLDVVKKELYGNVLIHVDSFYARYYPAENKNIKVRLDSINVAEDTTVTWSLKIHNHLHESVFEHRENVSLPYETTLTPILCDTSLYKITVTVGINETILHQKNTGFLVISEEEIWEELNAFFPMYIDENISTDFCLVEGKPTPILGTTYFVTDVYRRYLYNMNAWLCNKEMNQLKEIGFNVLRSGNWHYISDFYKEDGSICERGIRALQTYFLLAARNGFMVQFALGHVMLNQWNRDLSPIHNQQMRTKCMTYVRSFVENFQSYPNIVIDIVNEPSYSLKGAWTTGRPSDEQGELTRYHQWLTLKYNGKIENLRKAWGESSNTISDFQDITMPDCDLFSRESSRTQNRWNHTSIADFYAFSREEFLTWTAEVRRTIKNIAPHMTITMGRDEKLRAPEQQAEILAGNVDMVCWHQWNYDSNVITEYLLNRVKGKICVAQELGVYRFEDIRCGKRHTDNEIATRLEKKLLYAFGNFIQWQSHDDPYMYELCENSLGLFRADLSPTPAVDMVKNLISAEKNMQDYLWKKQEEKIKIVTVYGTSYHYSVDNPLATYGIRNHIFALYNYLKEQCNFMLEHLCKEEYAMAMGTPKLIILPAMQTLQKDIWNHLLTYVKNGSVLLVNGCIDKNEYFDFDDKIGKIDDSYTTRKLMNFETLTIGKKDYTLDFRMATGYVDVSNLLNCGQTFAGNTLTHYNIGKGTIIYCPYPIELSSNYEAICACYQYAIAFANAQNDIYTIVSAKPNTIFTADSYQHCTVYTMINEGFEDTISWIDLRSGVHFSIKVKENRGCKLWISDKGEVLQLYGEGTVSINDI